MNKKELIQDISEKSGWTKKM